MSLFIKVKLIEFTADLINVTHARRQKVVRHEIIMVNAPYVEFIGVLMMNVTVRCSSLAVFMHIKLGIPFKKEDNKDRLVFGNYFNKKCCFYKHLFCELSFYFQHYTNEIRQF